MNSLQEEKLEASMARKSVCKKRLNLKLQQQKYFNNRRIFIESNLKYYFFDL